MSRPRPSSVDAGLLIVRVGVGLLMTGHGVPKLTKGPAMWEGLGAAATAHLGISFAPTFFGFAAATAEGVGGILLALGLATRPSAALLAATMGMAFLHHYLSGDGWGAWNQAAKLFFVFGGLAVTGGGAWSVDRWASARLRPAEPVDGVA